MARRKRAVDQPVCGQECTFSIFARSPSEYKFATLSPARRTTAIPSVGVQVPLTRVAHPKPSNGFWISRHLHSPRNIDNSITNLFNLFIATENRRSDCRSPCRRKYRGFFGTCVRRFCTTVVFDSKFGFCWCLYIYIYIYICGNITEKLATISLWIEFSEDNAESH